MRIVEIIYLLRRLFFGSMKNLSASYCLIRFFENVLIYVFTDWLKIILSKWVFFSQNILIYIFLANLTKNKKKCWSYTLKHRDNASRDYAMKLISSFSKAMKNESCDGRDATCFTCGETGLYALHYSLSYSQNWN